MQRRRFFCGFLLSWLLGSTTRLALSQDLETQLVHLRSGTTREWSEFPETPQRTEIELRFASEPNPEEATLVIRQQDVKQTWRITLNDKSLGNLVIDENDMRLYVAIPAGTLKAADNVLKIVPASRNDKTTDDIRVGELQLDRRRPQVVLNDGTVELAVTDSDSGKPLPCRFTILDQHGSLQTTGIEASSRQLHSTLSKAWMKALVEKSALPTFPASNESENGGAQHLAVRAGVVFAAQGKARFGLPAGRYTVLAGRGFEYSLARAELVVTAGATVKRSLQIRREVATPGWVACDPHVHTLSYSGHGDAMLTERLITLAAEGVELPIATDHNVHVDFDQLAQRMELRQHFTPVIGNEVTTSVGHFNVFPIATGSAVVDPKQTEWAKLFDAIYATPQVKVAILNHARDQHSGVRPFGPKLHNALIGENWEGWPLRFNAMETINSGSTQYDILRLFHDWMGLLNRGLPVAPIGSSDSHDVARHFVGQARTYIRCDDRDVSQIDVAAATRSLTSGRVLVSYGLLTDLSIETRQPEAQQRPSQRAATIRVLGPHWVRADRVQLYVNGKLWREELLSLDRSDQRPLGVLWEGTWPLPELLHDVHLVAIATGPGIDEPHWRTAKPYQWLSPDWKARVAGCSEAIWIDVDGDGKMSSARDFARRVVPETALENLDQLVTALNQYDEAVVVQAAHLLVQLKVPAAVLEDALKAATPATRLGFARYRESVREHELEPR